MHYVYSQDGETFFGRYETRDLALAAALSDVGSRYFGRRSSGPAEVLTALNWDVFADFRMPYAEDILGLMRTNDVHTGRIPDGWLTDVPEGMREDLSSAIELVISGWFHRYQGHRSLLLLREIQAHPVPELQEGE